MELNNLMDLYVDELRDVYNAEKQVLRALPKMADKAAHDELRAAFIDHEKVTNEQVKRLDRIFDDLKMPPAGKKCLGMEGLIEEGKELMGEIDDEDALDAGLIGAAQKVEHYEIAAYGTARTHAEMLGYRKIAKLLQQTLNEEGMTDKKLTQLADSLINVEAVNA